MHSHWKHNILVLNAWRCNTHLISINLVADNALKNLCFFRTASLPPFSSQPTLRVVGVYTRRLRPHGVLVILPLQNQGIPWRPRVVFHLAPNKARGSGVHPQKSPSARRRFLPACVPGGHAAPRVSTVTKHLRLNNAFLMHFTATTLLLEAEILFSRVVTGELA